MQKIRLSYFEAMKAADLTATEIDYLIHISRFQTAAGVAPGVYYRDVCTALGISYQSFYNVQRSLQKKGLISVWKESQTDYNVLLVGNDCRDLEAVKREGYLNTGRTMFLMEKFVPLKAKEKILAMEMLKVTGASRQRENSARISRKKFCEKYAGLLQVTVRMIKEYMKTLKRFFWFHLEGEVFYLTPRKGIYQKPYGAMSETLVEKCQEVRAACRRNRIRKADEKAVEDVARLYQQYQEKFPEESGGLFTELIRKQKEKDHACKEGRLLPKLVHKLLLEKLETQLC